jgi:hypothetical protein
MKMKPRNFFLVIFIRCLRFIERSLISPHRGFSGPYSAIFVPGVESEGSGGSSGRKMGVGQKIRQKITRRWVKLYLRMAGQGVDSWD